MMVKQNLVLLLGFAILAFSCAVNTEDQEDMWKNARGPRMKTVTQVHSLEERRPRYESGTSDSSFSDLESRRTAEFNMKLCGAPICPIPYPPMPQPPKPQPPNPQPPKPQPPVLPKPQPTKTPLPICPPGCRPGYSDTYEIIGVKCICDIRPILIRKPGGEDGEGGPGTDGGQTGGTVSGGTSQGTFTFKEASSSSTYHESRRNAEMNVKQCGAPICPIPYPPLPLKVIPECDPEECLDRDTDEEFGEDCICPHKRSGRRDTNRGQDNSRGGNDLLFDWGDDKDYSYKVPVIGVAGSESLHGHGLGKYDHSTSSRHKEHTDAAGFDSSYESGRGKNKKDFVHHSGTAEDANESQTHGHAHGAHGAYNYYHVPVHHNKTAEDANESQTHGHDHGAHGAYNYHHVPRH